MDRYAELVDRYAGIPDQGRASGGYSLEAKWVFPQYNVVAAMLVEVERLDPDDLPPAPALSDALVRAAEKAQSPFTDPRGSDLEAAERRRFARTVSSWMYGAPLTAEPLGYRRVLSPDESTDWRRRLASRWGLPSDLAWHPMVAGPVPADVLVLRAEVMWDGPGADLVRLALRRLGRPRVVELRERGPEYLLEPDLLELTYTGAEGTWIDETLDWLAYASHEGTVALGGTVAAELAPHVEEWRWAGW